MDRRINVDRLQTLADDDNRSFSMRNRDKLAMRHSRTLGESSKAGADSTKHISAGTSRKRDFEQHFGSENVWTAVANTGHQATRLPCVKRSRKAAVKPSS